VYDNNIRKLSAEVKLGGGGGVKIGKWDIFNSGKIKRKGRKRKDKGKVKGKVDSM
jgi:hypothetical protein